MKRTIAGLIPNKNGTNTLAPNIANICCNDKGKSSFFGTFSST